jgi:hypothetical protein
LIDRGPKRVIGVVAEDVVAERAEVVPTLQHCDTVVDVSE